jgi:hypothetical protein
MACRPDPRRHPGRPAAPARPVHRHLQHPAAAPLAGAPRHPRGRLRRPAQSRPRRPHRRHHDRVRADIHGPNGTVTLRTGGKLYHIGVGRTHAGTHVLLLVRDLDIRIINAATGELLRQLTLDPTRNYQPTGRPPGPTPQTPRKRKNPEP